MADDILVTVRAALKRRDDDEAELPEDERGYMGNICDINITQDDLRLLLARCEQAEAERNTYRESQQVFLTSLNRAFGYTVGGPTAPCEFMDEVGTLRQNLVKAEADLTALRERHAGVVEAAFREGFWEGYDEQPTPHNEREDAAWLASEARKAVARDE